jgi:hypothetical protein
MREGGEAGRGRGARERGGEIGIEAMRVRGVGEGHG